MNMLDVPVTVLNPASLGDARHVVAEPTAIALSELEVGAFATIHAVLEVHDEGDRDLVVRLVELGFIPGERVRVIAAGRPGHQPIAVRLAVADSGRRNMNGATFAMRRHEADLIRVVPDASVDGAKKA
jgi:ferrous iron transport protein A